MSWTRRSVQIVLTAIISIGVGCDGSRPDAVAPRQDGSTRSENHLPTSPVVWGCDSSITELREHVEPGWREEAIVVGDFGFYSMKGNFSGFRPHRRADIQVKLPVMMEGHSVATMWIPQSQQDRVGVILADVPRRGPSNSYRLEDGHQAVRFEPCTDKEWTAWTAGFALADRRQIAVMVQVAGAQRPERVQFGPWEVAVTEGV